MEPAPAAARNVRVVSASNLLTGTYNNLLQVVLQPFVVGLTGSVVILSALQALATRLGGIVGSLAQFGGGVLTDRWGRKPVLLLGSVFNMASLSAFTLTALTGWWPLAVPAFVFLGLGLLSSPALQSTVAESVSVHGRAMAYSKVQFFLVLPAAGVAFAGGYVADRFGYLVIFAASLGLEATNFALFVLVLRETLRSREVAALEPRRSFRLREPRLRGFLVVTCIDSFVWTVSSMIIYGMIVQLYGFTDTDIGIIVGVWGVTFAATALPMGKLVERFGSRGLMLLSEAIGVPVMLGWILSRDVWQFAAISVLNGLTASTWVPAWQTYLANRVEDRVRGRVTGQIVAIRGLLAFPAPLLGGGLFAAYGYAAPMEASFVGMFVAMGAVVRYIHDRPLGAAPERALGGEGAR